MARINSLRVSDVVDYDKDIKGKRLIRLAAGVCSGKNTWVVKTAELHPELRILLITSRKNTVLAQANKLEANTFIDLNVLNSSSANNETKRVICTNASIESFFKLRFDINDKSTHLWYMFDLIVLDEAHALTTDALFTDCFYTERFLKHCYYKNDKCDIVFMSGTLAPLDWMLNRENTPYIHDLDCFDKCVHLEPDFVYVVNKDAVPYLLSHKLLNGERIVYFANYKNRISTLTKQLIELGIPADSIGYSFNISKEEDILKFPEEIQSSLSDTIENINEALNTTEKLPPKYKILFTTSKNKEGINILDDDIKTVIAETHSKSDLIQISGRIRGNPETGKGIQSLFIVGDAKQHNQFPSEFTFMWNKHIVDSLSELLNECIDKNMKNISSPDNLLNQLPQYSSKDTHKDAYRYIRYDYISQKYALYQGRIEGERQHTNDCLDFSDIARRSVIRFASSGERTLLNSEQILKDEWFKWSNTYIFFTKDKEHKKQMDIVDAVHNILLQFFIENNFIGENMFITKNDRDSVIRDKILELANIYGYDNLGIKENFKSVGTALKALQFQLKEHSKKRGYEKYRIVSNIVGDIINQ